MTKTQTGDNTPASVENAQDAQGSPPSNGIDPRVAELARKLGIADPAALLTVSEAFTQALTVEEQNFEAVRQAVLSAVGDYRGFTTITVTNKDGELTCERNVGKVKRSGGNGTGNGKSFNGMQETLPDELVAKYQLPEATFKSRRALANALAKSLGKEEPAANAYYRWLKNNAQDVWEHIGSPMA